MTRSNSVASLVAAYNTLAAMLPDVKPMSAKTSLNRATITARTQELQERVDATTELVSLVSLCNAHNRNAKSMRAKFRDLYARKDNTLPAPVATKKERWNYRPSDVPAIIAHIAR